MTARKRVSSNNDANFLLRHDPLPAVRAWIESLPDSPRNNYLRDQVFSKYVDSGTVPGPIRKERAIAKWLATEERNMETNSRLLNTDPDFNILPRVTYARFMRTVNGLCQSILGEVVPADALSGAFSGGATTSRKRTHSHPAKKYVGRADITPRALNFGISEILGSPTWCEALDELDLVESNVMFTVPKNAEIDRCCCKEPDLNMYMQKGCGDYISRRLKRVGIDLNDQSRNRSLAKKGSIDGTVCTIDLSSASDSLSKELVFQCLPIHWYNVLDTLRCHSTVLPDGTIHENEMFSSMGNGFTFELESLLFYVIARATMYHLGISGILSVYGDDIIAPTEGAEYLIYVLKYLGFLTNSEKTFYTGTFRESCGGHFDNGHDITPFYVRKPIKRVIDLIHLCNSLRQWSLDPDCKYLRSDAEDLWSALSLEIPRRFWGGVNLDDKSRLVSLWHPPHPKLLIPRKGKKKWLGIGGYLLWLNSTHGRRSPDDGISTSAYQIESGTYNEKVVEFLGPVTDHWFLTESVAVPMSG